MNPHLPHETQPPHDAPVPPYPTTLSVAYRPKRPGTPEPESAADRRCRLAFEWGFVFSLVLLLISLYLIFVVWDLPNTPL